MMSRCLTKTDDMGNKALWDQLWRRGKEEMTRIIETEGEMAWQSTGIVQMNAS